MKTLKHKNGTNTLTNPYQQKQKKNKSSTNTLTNLTNNIQDQKTKKNTQQQYNVTYNKFKNLDNM